MDLIFEKFQRAGDQLTTAIEGTGLGLTISSSIINAHGGKLWFTPNPAGGACFHFTLPVALGEAND